MASSRHRHRTDGHLTLVMVLSFTAGHGRADRLQSTSPTGWTWAQSFTMAWRDIVRWPAAFAFAVTAIASVYHFAPDVKRIRVDHAGIRRCRPLWLVISLGFKWYVFQFGNYQQAYHAMRRAVTVCGSILGLDSAGRTTERDDRPRLATPSGGGAEGRVSSPSGRPYIVAYAAPLSRTEQRSSRDFA